MAKGSIELEIRGWLLQRLTAEEIFSRLADRFPDPEFTYENRHKVFSFAANANLYKIGLEVLSVMLNNRGAVPWAWTLEFFAKAKSNPERELKEAILKGAERQEHSADLALTFSWDKFIPEIVAIKSTAHTERVSQAKKQKQTLLEKLAFFRNEQLTDEEKRLLSVLRKMYPADEEIKNLESQFSERWARHVITHHARPVSSDWSEHTLTLTDPDADQAVAPMVAEMAMLATDRHDVAYEFGVALLMMEQDEKALPVILSSPLDGPLSWLLVEALLRARRFVDCLDQLTKLEQSFGGDAETTFATTYLRAQAYWGLGQGPRAIELLEALTAIRPQYRSAASLLKEWMGGLGK
jgi:hypothetical protein